MKPYTVEIDIDLPRDKMLELFEDMDNMVKWQTGLVSVERISGEPGQPGSKSKYVYHQGKREIELIETVTVRNLPDQFDGYYEWDGGKNILENQFIELGPDKTRWVSKCSYEFTSKMLKIMGFFFGGMFRKQNLKYLRNFKAFCETGHDVRESGDFKG